MRDLGDKPIKLNVGGRYYTTSRQTLTRFPESMLGAMFSGRHVVNVEEEDGAVFIDRDGDAFKHILNFLRNPAQFNSDMLSPLALKELKSEADYFGLRSVMFPIVEGKNQSVLGYCNVTKQTQFYLIGQDIRGVWGRTRMCGQKRKFTPLVHCIACQSGIFSYKGKLKVIPNFGKEFEVLNVQQNLNNSTCSICGYCASSNNNKYDADDNSLSKWLF